MKTFAVLFLLLSLPASAAKSAPSFRGELLSGEKTSLEARLKPGRVLLVSFWATWCVPCLQELATVKEKLAKDPTIPLDVLTVNVDRENRSEVPATIRQLGLEFPVLMDPSQDIFGKYQKGQTLPFSVLISSDKLIEQEFNGYHDSMFDKIREVTARLNPKAGK